MGSEQKRRILVLLASTVALSGCRDIQKIINNDKCCCVTTLKYFSCSDKKAYDSCTAVLEPGNIDSKGDYNSCKDASLRFPDPLDLLGADIVLAYQPGGANAPKVIGIPGQAYANSVSRIRATLDRAVVKHTPTPISSFLNELSWDKANLASISQILQRGPLVFKDNVVQSDGRDVDIKFQDERLGSIEISLPSHLTATLARAAGSLRFTFPTPPVVILQGVATKYQIPSNQRLDSIAFTADAIDYDFHASSNTAQKLKITLKLSQATAQRQNAGEPGLSATNVAKQAAR